jgi:hypothetical protein
MVTAIGTENEKYKYSMPGSPAHESPERGAVDDDLA